MVHFLEVPLVGPGLQIQRDNRDGKEVIAAPRGAIVVGARISDRHVHHLEIRIDGGMRPHWTAAILPGVSLPAVVAELARTGERPELPDLLAGAGVVGAELTANAPLAAAYPDINQSVVIRGRRAGRAACGI